MKKLLLGLIILILIDVLVFFALKSRNDGVTFKTEKVLRGDLEATVPATGTLNPVVTVPVSTYVSGTISDVYADFNSRVREGQLLAQIDPTPFEADVQRAKAQCAAAHASLEKARVRVLEAERALRRHRDLFQRNLVARSTLDNLESAYFIARSDAEEAKAKVAEAEATLRGATANLMATGIRSPIEGVVLSRLVTVGQTVASHIDPPTLFVVAKDLKKMQIDAKVDEADIGKVSLYQQAVFTVDTYPDTVFKGMVAQIRNTPHTIQNMVAYDVIIMVDNPDLKFKPGMTANVSIITASKKDVMMVPNAALRFKPPEHVRTKGAQKGGVGVWILEDSVPQHVAIEVGISDGLYSEVVSGDLREGQEVIVEATSTKQDQSQSDVSQNL